MHDDAFVLVHESRVLPPLAIGVAVRLAVGAGTTVTVFESLAVPATPVHVSANVVFVESVPLAALPLVALEPDQPPPDALHEPAFVLVHDTCVVAPLATLAGLTVTLTVGGPTTATDLASLALPPAPAHVSVNVVLVESALLVALPLAACAPAQPPDAVHDVALVLVQESCVVPPIATLLGFRQRHGGRRDR